MNSRSALLLSGLILVLIQSTSAQGGNMNPPKTIEAGAAFSIQTSGSGNATLYIIGPVQVLKRNVQLGEAAFFPVGSLNNAGNYLATLAGDSFTESHLLDVLPASTPAALSFLAKPSRLQVGLHEGITGAIYVFDAYQNLIVDPLSVSFELSSPSGTVQKRNVETRHGAAWAAMDSTTQQGIDKFAARTGDVYATRIVGQVPGDPCGLKMTARQAGQTVQLTTDPLRDCSGNAIPDGTIVTFTETYSGAQSTVDVPLKHGIAQVQMPTHSGALISVASGVVAGNQIRWEK